MSNFFEKQKGLLPAVLILVAAMLFVYFAMPDRRLSSLAMKRSGTVVAADDEEPLSLLSRGPTDRPTLETPLTPPCLDCDSIDGVVLGDRNIYPNSYMSPIYFNTGAFTQTCGENPAKCMDN